jgi:hypothetical protein
LAAVRLEMFAVVADIDEVVILPVEILLAFREDMFASKKNAVSLLIFV